MRNKLGRHVSKKSPSGEWICKGTPKKNSLEKELERRKRSIFRKSNKLINSGQIGTIKEGSKKRLYIEKKERVKKTKGGGLGDRTFARVKTPGKNHEKKNETE